MKQYSPHTSMLLSGFLLFLIVTSAHSWLLTTTHDQVARKVSQNITISCNNANPSGISVNSLSQISRIRILKNVKETQWLTVAKVTETTNAIVTSFADATVSGHIGSVRNSFLSIHFNYANEETVGVYQCEIDGFDLDDDIKEIKTEEMKVSERGMSFDDLFGIIKDLETKEEKDISLESVRTGLLEKAVSVLQDQGKVRAGTLVKASQDIDSIRTKSKLLSNDLNKVQTQLKAQQELSRQMQIFQIDWPEGVYGLPQPNTACPITSTFNWQISNVRISTETSSSNQDAVSSPNHLPATTLQTSGSYRYVNVYLCTKSVPSAGPGWPKGRYCINEYTKSCPTNFFQGTVTYDRKNIGGLDLITNLPSATHNTDITQINYCCRNDGQTATPILLPSKTPFYLYRYQGTCQEVFGMKVTNEWIQLDTDGTKDSYNNVYHPDLSKTGGVIKIQLCYYTPIL